LRQEYLERTGGADGLGVGTEVFTRVVRPLIEGDRDARQAAHFAARACEGLHVLADHIDGSWWRAVAATVAGLPEVPAWLDDQVAAFLKSEPLLANAMPPCLAERYVVPAQLRNAPLSPLDLDSLAGSISAKLASYPDLPERIRRYAEIYSSALGEVMSPNPISGQSS
jgi:hypothetical protein